jgi:chromosomal replication initiator protein
MTQEELWGKVLAQIELNPNISKTAFNTWFTNTSIIARKNGGVIISVPHTFVKDYLEKKYNKYVLKSLRNIDNTIKRFECKIRKNDERILEKISNPTIEKEEQLKIENFQMQKSSNLNNRYNFDNFVTGPFNELAHAAASAVAENPGKVYNPLFVYGGVGLGKTHLLQAIGNKVTQEKHKVVRYVPTEKFVSNIISAIQNREVEELRDRYKEVDVLIFDDVQFLSGKEKTQEEFFFLFNSLYGSNKQIILSSDRSPKAISTLTERLRSRFEGGMIADISIPKLETKIAILKEKCLEKKVEVSEEILNYIATKIKRNIRELEGALNIILAHQKLNNERPSFEKAKALLRNVTSSPKKNINAKKIIQAVANFYDLTIQKLSSSSRKKEVVKPRQVAMYLLRKELESSYPFIGRKFGGRDHTTAIHSYKKISKEIEKDKKLEEEIELIKHNILCV